METNNVASHFSKLAVKIHEQEVERLKNCLWELSHVKGEDSFKVDTDLDYVITILNKKLKESEVRFATAKCKWLESL